MCDLRGDELLYRRVSEFHLTKDSTISSAAFESYRVSSSNFNNEELSVDRACLVDSPEVCLSQYADQGLVSLTIQDATHEKLSVRADPIENNRAHALIVGKKSKRVSKALASASNWVIAVQGYQISTSKLLRK